MVRRARIGGHDIDLRIEGDRIAAVGPDLPRAPGEDELDARGGAVLPGLHDHHLHVLASVAAAASVQVGPPQVGDGAAFRAALTAAAAARPRGEWIRAVGYHQSVSGHLDRDALDRVVSDHPLRVQHRSGVLWVLNSAGVAALEIDGEVGPGVERDPTGRPTGRLWRMDHWLAERLGRAGAGRRQPLDLSGLSAAAAAAGVTGWTDATPERSEADTEVLLEAAGTGVIAQRLHLMLPAGADAAMVARLRGVGVTAGPVKILLDDPNLPSLDELAGVITRAHRQGLPVAVHCVTRVQLLLTMAALDVAGARPGDRVEHGAVIPAEALPRLAGAGLIVVTQPNFVAERGDQYLSDVPPEDLRDLWRGRSLADAGVAMAAGTDAPFGSPDPWLAIRAAVRRRTASGRLLGAREAVGARTALEWWWGTGPAPAGRRQLQAGEQADLVVLAAPLPEAVDGEDRVPVRATVVAGRLVTREKG